MSSGPYARRATTVTLLRLRAGNGLSHTGVLDTPIAARVHHLRGAHLGAGAARGRFHVRLGVRSVVVGRRHLELRVGARVGMGHHVRACSICRWRRVYEGRVELGVVGVADVLAILASGLGVGRRDGGVKDRLMVVHRRVAGLGSGVRGVLGIDPRGVGNRCNIGHGGRRAGDGRSDGGRDGHALMLHYNVDLLLVDVGGCGNG